MMERSVYLPPKGRRPSWLVRTIGKMVARRRKTYWPCVLKPEPKFPLKKAVLVASTALALFVGPISGVADANHQKMRIKFGLQHIATEIIRPNGLLYQVLTYGAPYNYLTDIPAGSLRYDTGNSGGPFPSVPAAMAAALAANKALILPPGTYTITAAQLSNKAVPMYGEGPLGSVIFQYTGTLTNSTPCFAYMFDRDVFVRGIEWQNFGDLSTRPLGRRRSAPQPACSS
jgi:hypothetical protein